MISNAVVDKSMVPTPSGAMLAISMIVLFVMVVEFQLFAKHKLSVLIMDLFMYRSRISRQVLPQKNFGPCFMDLFRDFDKAFYTVKSDVTLQYPTSYTSYILPTHIPVAHWHIGNIQNTEEVVSELQATWCCLDHCMP